jgi:hypothetical protein
MEWNVAVVLYSLGGFHWFILRVLVFLLGEGLSTRCLGVVYS